MKILTRWYEEVWNKGNEKAIDELLASDAVIHNFLGSNKEKTLNMAGYKKSFREVRADLSDVQVKVEHELTEGDMSAARCVIRATHQHGALRKKKPIHFTGMVLVRVRDGKIVESWNHFDFETMYQQME